MEYEDLLENLKDYSEEDIKSITKAYLTADELHKGQLRESGEDYIIHPLNVAYTLSLMHADADTICAGFLHDTLEDTHITKEDIAYMFNQDVATLVDGVTKISKMNFSSKQEGNLANTRKIITSITKDVRIIIIKLADRLHNMRTLEYKSEFKQKENSLETLEIFVPLAYYIGAYKIKSELEDLSLQYLKPDKYREIAIKRNKLELDTNELLQEMKYKISCILQTKDIPSNIKTRTKNIYGIYRRLENGERLSDIHDLFAIKVIIDEFFDCYISLGLIHSLYNPVNDKFKDFMWNKKTNMYQSLHTTVFAPDDKIIQIQIRTKEMDNIATNGLTSYFYNNKNARDDMQNDLRNKFQFFKSLTEINSVFLDNKDFVDQVKKELLSTNIYVYNTEGKIIELPKGSTIVDFAFKLGSNIGYTMIGATVNDKLITNFDYELKNNDIVRIMTSEISFGPRDNWLDYAHTTHAKKKIKEFNTK